MSRFVWTPDLERRARVLKASGMTCREVAAAVGAKRGTVIRYFWERGMGGGPKWNSRRYAGTVRTDAPSRPRTFSWEAA